MEQSQTSRFITYLRERLKPKAEHPVIEAQAQLAPGDLSLIEQFIEHIDGAQQGRDGREADPQYQTELEASL